MPNEKELNNDRLLYQAQLWEFQRGIFLIKVVADVEGENEPEHRTGAPDENSFSKAGREFWQICVPGQVSVPEWVVTT